MVSYPQAKGLKNTRIMAQRGVARKNKDGEVSEKET